MAIRAYKDLRKQGWEIVELTSGVQERNQSNLAKNLVQICVDGSTQKRLKHCYRKENLETDQSPPKVQPVHSITLLFFFVCSFFIFTC